jgi:hypothetical protein
MISKGAADTFDIDLRLRELDARAKERKEKSQQKI